MLVHKLEVSGEFFFSLQLPCLPTCKYGNGSVSWTVIVSYKADFCVDLMVGFVTIDGAVVGLSGC